MKCSHGLTGEQADCVRCEVADMPPLPTPEECRELRGKGGSMIDQETAERYEAVLKRLKMLRRLKGTWYQLTGEKIDQLIDEALNPPPEMEEVVRWQCQACLMYGAPIVDNDVVCGNCGKPLVVKLTGKFTRPKPRKVLRREEIEWNDYDALLQFVDSKNVVPKGFKLFAEREEEQ